MNFYDISMGFFFFWEGILYFSSVCANLTVTVPFYYCDVTLCACQIPRLTLFSNSIAFLYRKDTWNFTIHNSCTGSAYFCIILCATLVSFSLKRQGNHITSVNDGWSFLLTWKICHTSLINIWINCRFTFQFIFAKTHKIRWICQWL